jgi:hypothetical protein
MEITPALGIGDIIIYKLYEIYTKQPITHIMININLLKYARSNYNNSLQSITFIISKLFPDGKISIIDQDIRLTCPVKFKDTIKSLYSYFKYDKPYKLPAEQYIVIHTKARFDTYHDKFSSEIPEIESFMSKYANKLPIVIMGERTISNNTETRKHHIISIYEILIKSLSKNNNIIDMSTELLSEGSDPESFQKDIEIIHNAEYNITFGIGGNFVISNVTSEKCISYIGNSNHWFMNMTYDSGLHIFSNNLTDFLSSISSC